LCFLSLFLSCLVYLVCLCFIWVHTVRIPSSYRHTRIQNHFTPSDSNSDSQSLYSSSSTQYHLPSCLRFLEVTHTVETLREAGPDRLHVKRNGIDVSKCGTCLSPFFLQFTWLTDLLIPLVGDFARVSSVFFFLRGIIAHTPSVINAPRPARAYAGRARQ